MSHMAVGMDGQKDADTGRPVKKPWQRKRAKNFRGREVIMEIVRKVTWEDKPFRGNIGDDKLTYI